jgi:hypothetical protein
MNNKTSKELSSAKLDSRKYHAKLNEKLYKEYIESGEQFTKTFTEWKQSKTNKSRKKKSEFMQKKLTPSERKAREKAQAEKGAVTLNRIYRYT